MMDGFLGFLTIVTMIILYFVPTIVAYKRKHHNTLAIGALNLIFGYTGFGWGIAFVWALTRVDREP